MPLPSVGRPRLVAPGLCSLPVSFGAGRSSSGCQCGESDGFADRFDLSLPPHSAYRLRAGRSAGLGLSPTSCSSVARKYGILFLRRMPDPPSPAVLRIWAVCS